MALSFRDRLRQGLQRTRERLSLGSSIDAADFDALEEALITADVGVGLTDELLTALRGRGTLTREALKKEMLGALSFPAAAKSAKERAVGPRGTTKEALERPDLSSPAADARPFVTMLIGVNGVGKTTTLAKLAHLATNEKERVIVIAGDTFRAAAKEQLQAWATRTGTEMVEGEEGSDPAAVVHDGLQSARSVEADRVLIDTAGRLHNKKPLMDELSKIARTAGRVIEGAPHETLLVMDATVGSNGLSQAKLFAESIPVSGIVLTKLDGTAKGGVVFSIAKELSLPVRYVGVGEKEQDLLPFVPEDFLDALLGD